MQVTHEGAVVATNGARRRLGTLARFGAVVLAASFAMTIGFVLLEGLSSAVLSLQQLLAGRGGSLAERRYTGYDPELGWVSQPNVYIPDMFGKGVYLRTNSRGFRNNEEFGVAAPAGKLRVVCSGDSFTFGYGVDNEHTWCELLTGIDPRIETINMGQGGYGIDQAFLWYRRDGARLKPAIHLFAFIGHDFERMRSSRFLQYGKPTLQVRGGELAVENVPVPSRLWFRPPVRMIPVIRGLKSYELVMKMRGQGANERSAGGIAATAGAPETRDGHFVDMVLKVFSALQEMATSGAGQMVLVYLPGGSDCRGQRSGGEDWWSAVMPKAAAAGLKVVDLTADCARLTAAEVDGLFLREGEVDYYEAGGHYTVSGNAFIAGALYRQLIKLPGVAEQFASAGSEARGRDPAVATGRPAQASLGRGTGSLR